MSRTVKLSQEPFQTFQTELPSETTATTGLYIIELQPSNPISQGMLDIDDIFDELSKDPVFAAETEEAGKWVADTYFQGEHSLKTLRLSKGISQKQLAELIGSRQPYIARLESGTGNPTMDTVMRIAKALGDNPLKIFETIMREHHYG